jgi:hypothetical protein
MNTNTCPYTGIKKRMVGWINHILRPKREEFGGMPVCPWAGAELDQGRLMVDIFDPSKCTFIDKVKEFHDSKYTSALLAHVKNTLISEADTRHYQSFLNKQLKANGYNQYKAICFNPKDSASDIDGFNPRQFAPAFLINLANKKELSKAHRIILKTDYFKRMSDEYKKYLKV